MEKQSTYQVISDICPNCGKPFCWTTAGIRCGCVVQKVEYSYTPNKNFGWVCPVCFKVNSPDIKFCDHIGGRKVEWSQE